jgi:hypothetical protein
MAPHAVQGKAGSSKFVSCRLTLTYSCVLLALCIISQIQIVEHTTVNKTDILPESVSIANLVLYSIVSSLLLLLSVLQHKKVAEIFCRISEYYKPDKRILQYFIFAQCFLSFIISVLTTYSLRLY